MLFGGTTNQPLTPAGGIGAVNIPPCKRCGKPITLRTLAVPGHPLCDDCKRKPA